MLTRRKLLVTVGGTALGLAGVTAVAIRRVGREPSEPPARQEATLETVTLTIHGMI